jgi:hypothetical protein
MRADGKTELGSDSIRSIPTRWRDSVRDSDGSDCESSLGARRSSALNCHSTSRRARFIESHFPGDGRPVNAQGMPDVYDSS